jgi:hypothetical protein
MAGSIPSTDGLHMPAPSVHALAISARTAVIHAEAAAERCAKSAAAATNFAEVLCHEATMMQVHVAWMKVLATAVEANAAAASATHASEQLAQRERSRSRNRRMHHTA